MVKETYTNLQTTLYNPPDILNTSCAPVLLISQRRQKKKNTNSLFSPLLPLFWSFFSYDFRVF